MPEVGLHTNWIAVSNHLTGQPKSGSIWLLSILTDLYLIKKLPLGMATVTLQVKSLKDERRFIEEEFVVDSITAFTVVPKQLWIRLE